jgi:hypothetical protein
MHADTERTRLSSKISPTRIDLSSYTEVGIEPWTSKAKVAGSIPAPMKQNFQLAQCEHTRLESS